MNSVFIDLEFDEVDKVYKAERKKSRFEVIELGAVKVDEDGNIIDRFDAYVKPQYSSLSAFVLELTHISKESIQQAASFCEVMDEFLGWVGTESVAVYSWSDADWIQLQKESRLKGYRSAILDDMYENWIDFQMVFSEILGINQQLSLENAVGMSGLFEGQAHSALSDAENTARLYILTQNKEEWEEKAGAILELLVPKPLLTVPLGRFFPPELMSYLSA